MGNGLPKDMKKNSSGFLASGFKIRGTKVQGFKVKGERLKEKGTRLRYEE